MKWIITLGLAGWTAIVALAWLLAEQRRLDCWLHDSGCIERAGASRDAVLIWGPGIALAVLLVLGLAARARLNRARGPASTNRVAQHRLD